MENYNNGGDLVNVQEDISTRTDVPKVSPPYFSREEVYNATLVYFNGDDLPTNVWIDKYCLKDNEFRYLELTPDDMHKRLAKEFARIEQKYSNPLQYDEIYNLLKNFKYIIPGGSNLYGIGNNYSFTSLSNCFVVSSPIDSYGGIFTTDQEIAQLEKRRCGVGTSLDTIRPMGSYVTNSAGTSTGILPFAERFSNTTREVAQDGRRGALMECLIINHPDIEQFITSKDDLSKLTGANISVKITDEFMKAVENDEDFGLHFPTDYLDETNVFNTKGIEARELWDKLIYQAWKSAEPGVLFWDKITNESIPSCYGEEWKETSTNP